MVAVGKLPDNTLNIYNTAYRNPVLIVTVYWPLMATGFIVKFSTINNLILQKQV